MIAPRIMAYLFCVALGSGFMNIGSVLAATTTRNVPFGTGIAWLPPLPYIPNLVLFANASKSALNAGSESISAISAPTIVIPAGCPPAAMALGESFQKEFGGGAGIGIGWLTCQPASCNATSKWRQNCQLSDASGRYQISTGALGFPAISLANISWLSVLGPASVRSCSNWRVASAVSFRAVSACAVNSAMRSFAFAVPSFAASESATARFVSTSFTAMRSSEYRSFIAANLIVPYVPSATSTAPTNRTTLERSNQRLAPSGGTSNIKNLTDLLFAVFCFIWLAVIYEAGKKAYKRLRR